MAKPKQNEVAHVAVPVEGRLIPRHGIGLADCPTNLDLSTEEGRCLAVAALGEGDLSFDEAGNCRLNVSHYLVTPGEAIDPDTGEVKRFPRLVLFTPDHHTLVTTSVVVPHRLAAVLDLFGPGPWNPPLSMEIRERRARKTGRTYHELRVLPRE